MKIKIDKADSLFSLWIRKRDKWTCQRCWRIYPEGSQIIHNSHYYGRGKENTRFEPDNCDAICFGCHQYFHANPNEYREWKLKQIGTRRFDTLMVQAHTYKKKDRKLEIIKWTQALKEVI